MFCVNMFVLYRISKKMYSLYSNDPRFKSGGCIIKRERWLLQMSELVAFVTRRLERGTKITLFPLTMPVYIYLCLLLHQTAMKIRFHVRTVMMTGHFLQ